MNRNGNRNNPEKNQDRQGGDTHRESRDHNKHNNPGQSGHKPQQHSPDQQKR